MFTSRIPLILASSSPRRREFFDQLGLKFSVMPAHIDETPLPAEAPEDFARRMALDKAKTLALQHPKSCVIAADTVVALGGTIFGKPLDGAAALSYLEQLQGRTHRVITGIAVVCADAKIEESRIETTSVTFDHFNTSILQAYVKSGDPLDKAGAYGIQGQGTFLVRSITGSYSNVVGLPVNQLITLLFKHQIIEPN
ncbi:MAG: Maf family protein [Desulfobulbus sp.]|nr:Maf family protein [Desulfobulbus sp.]